MKKRNKMKISELKQPYRRMAEYLAKSDDKNDLLSTAQNRIYTQLAKEGKFDELPDTCEFSEPVELEVWDDDGDYLDKIEISGKYKGYYIDCTSTGLYSAYQHAQLPTKKIDFTQFKTGDIVEVDAFGLYYGYLESNKEDYIQLSFSSFSTSTRRILKKDIKSITILK